MKRTGDELRGYKDATNGFPRSSTRPYYRKGYDRGLTEVIENARRLYNMTMNHLENLVKE